MNFFRAGQTWTVKVLENDEGGIYFRWESPQPVAPPQPLLEEPYLKPEPPPRYTNTGHALIMARGSWTWHRFGAIYRQKTSPEETSRLQERMDRRPALMAMMDRHCRRAYKTTNIGYGALGAAYIAIASEDERLAEDFFKGMLGTSEKLNKDAPIPRWIREKKIGPFEYPWRSAVLTLLEFFDVMMTEHEGNVEERHIEGVLQRVKEKM